MLAAVGCLIPEGLSMSGVEVGEPVWWKVGAAKLQGDLTLNWGGIEVRVLLLMGSELSVALRRVCRKLELLLVVLLASRCALVWTKNFALP